MNGNGKSHDLEIQHNLRQMKNEFILEDNIQIHTVDSTCNEPLEIDLRKF